MKVSMEAQKVLYQEETGDYPILLLTIDHPSLDDPIRISTDSTERSSLTTDEQVVYCTISNNLEYVFYPVEITLPSEDETKAPTVTMSIANTGKQIVDIVRSFPTSPTVRMDLVLGSNPDKIEGSFSGFKFETIDIDIMTISGDLVLDILTTEPFPYRTFTPSTASGLFKY